MARKLDEAPRAGGLYYLRDGTAVDANGVPLDGAPARPDDTKVEDQPHARLASSTTIGAGGAPSAFDFKALGASIAEGLTQAAGRAAANAQATQESEQQRDAFDKGASGAKTGDRPAIVPGSATAEAFGGPNAGAVEAPVSETAGVGASPTGVGSTSTLTGRPSGPAAGSSSSASRSSGAPSGSTDNG